MGENYKGGGSSGRGEVADKRGFRRFKGATGWVNLLGLEL